MAAVRFAIKTVPEATSWQAQLDVWRAADEIELSVTAFFEEMHNKRELVTAFIAVLEIVRTEGIKLMQSKTFGDIILKKV